MRGSSIRARRPRGRAGADARLIVQCDPDVLGSYLEDAAHYSGGHASGLVVARSEQEIAEALARHAAVLPIGAQSSLTGGATPMGELVISTSRLNRIVDIGADCARVEAGVTLTELEAVLSRANRYYPPSPTFFGAFVGGTIATNAAGAATFKYGATRDWIQSITVVLSSGDVLDIERGTTRADADG